MMRGKIAPYQWVKTTNKSRKVTCHWLLILLQKERALWYPLEALMMRMIQLSLENSFPVSKKAPSNTFPLNARSLLLTGILDEIPVKYKTWSWQVNLVSMN